MILFTWNLQGASHSLENKWNTGVLNLFAAGKADVCCLQECGGVPESAKLLTPSVKGIPNLDLYTWGTTRALRHILFYPADTGGNRCNLALVSRVKPGDFALLMTATPPVWRPAVGMLVSGHFWFTVHAISPKGPDAPGLLAAICALGVPWIAAADFNREPDTLPDARWSVCPPDQYTYSTQEPKARYDYATAPPGTAVTGQVQSMILSDHFPVRFEF